MESLPMYEEDGSEELSYENIWRNIDPQEISGVDCFDPNVNLRPDDNLVTLRLTAIEFKEMFSALYAGAEILYPESFMQMIVNFLRGFQCPPELQERECSNLPPYSPFISYPLQDPFSEPDLVPDGYLIPPMTVVTAENAGDYPDSEIGDVIVNFNSFPLDTGWFDDIHEDLPSVLINVEGTGTVGVEFTPMVQGGLAIVTLDNPPNLVDILAGIITGADNIVDVNKDTLSVPPETADQIIFPIEVETGGSHTIYVVFFPIIDDSFVPVRFGGGIRKVELCGFLEMDMSCEEIEDCLEESPTIEAINTSINNIENNVTVVQDAVADIEDCGCGGNVYPPAPDPYERQDEPEFSKLCGAAAYLAQKIIDFLGETETNAGMQSLENFLIGFLSSFGYTAQLLKILYEMWGDNENPTLGNDIEDALSELTEILFCANLEKEAAIEAINASGTLSADVKDALEFGINALADGLWETWIFVGGETQQEDCSGFCNWKIVYNFDGTYVPDDSESAIYDGDTWEPSGANFVSGTGYVGFVDVWTITKQLPPDCKITSMQTCVSKNEPCTAVDISVIWRGTSGEDAPTFTPEGRCLTNEQDVQDWTILPLGIGAELDETVVRSNHFFCGGENYGSKVHWVVVQGTGARPN